jgi:hypothetical protein
VAFSQQPRYDRAARACTVAPPKPAALAKWLVDLACDGPGWPRVLLPEFAGALGDRGTWLSSTEPCSAISIG